MKNILLIGSELGKGGAERSLSLLSYYLSDYFNVTLCILSGTDRKQYYPTCTDVRFIDPPEATGIWSKILAWRYRLRAVKALKKETGCIAAISFLEGPNYVNVLTRGNEKVILSVRGSSYFDKEISGGIGWFRKKVSIPLLYPRADRIVCASRQLTDELNHHFGIPRQLLSYVYNIYDDAAIRNQSKVALLGEEAMIFHKPVIIASGRLHQQKRHASLIRLFSLLPAESRGRLVIMGNGPLKNALMDAAPAYGLQLCDMSDGKPFKPADVYLLGYQANPFKFYAHSRLFVLCSGWEGFPNAMAEALICGLPVLAADCATGPREILDVPLSHSAPTGKVHRLPVGALMPMLHAETPESVLHWKSELNFWMAAPRPSQQAFERLTQRFQKEDVIRKWVQFINDTVIPILVLFAMAVCAE